MGRHRKFLFVALKFFGCDRVVFGTDTPFDQNYVRSTIEIIDKLDISESEREAIYWKNAEKLLGLSTKVSFDSRGCAQREHRGSVRITGCLNTCAPGVRV